jgi:vitamin B12 transporter
LGFPTTPNAEQSMHEVRQLFAREEAVLSTVDGRIKNHFGVNYTDEWKVPTSLPAIRQPR